MNTLALILALALAAVSQRGFFANGQVDEFVCLTHGPGDEQHFRAFAAREGVARPIRGVRLESPAGIAMSFGEHDIR